MKTKLGSVSPELHKASSKDLQDLEQLEREEEKEKEEEEEALLEVLESELLEAYRRRRATKFEQLSKTFGTQESEFMWR